MTTEQPATAPQTHTPGPWTVSEEANKSVAIYGRGPVVSGVIATVDCGWCHKDQQDEQRANARLIASSPDLLEALKSCVDSAWPNKTEHPAMFAAWQKASIAIATATGERHE